jgi:hypothetical protein
LVELDKTGPRTANAVNVTDDYDPADYLAVTVQHRLNGTETWDDYLTPKVTYDDATGTWTTTISPLINAKVGSFDFRVNARDLDTQSSGWVEFPNALQILNNLPTTPVVRITPEGAVTTAFLEVAMDASSTDVETLGLSYVYRWYRDGVLVQNATSAMIPSTLTSKGENWSVEVAAYDGEDEGLPGTAWMVIANAPPFPAADLSDPEMEEDTTDDQWLNLVGAFDDPDGDELTWYVTGTSENLTVTIDAATGKVTIEPALNWHGKRKISRRASW